MSDDLGVNRPVDELDGSVDGEAQTDTGTGADTGFTPSGTAESGTFQVPDPITWWDAGFQDVIPVVPPDGIVRHGSDLKPGSLGKAPGFRHANGTWTGFPHWRVHRAKRLDVVTWRAWGANVGLRATSYPAVDIDNRDPALLSVTAGICDLAVMILGWAPQRTGQWPKVLLPYATDEPMTRERIWFKRPDRDDKHVVELLGAGQQYVVGGMHPCGQPYRWDVDPTSRDIGARGLTKITIAQAKSFMQAVREYLLTEGMQLTTEGSARGAADRAGVSQERLKVGDPDFLEELVRQFPNDNDTFPHREEYLRLGYALKGAYVDDPERGYGLWEEWACKWPGNDRYPEGNNPETVRSDWNRMKPPFALGEQYILDVAASLGLGGEIARHDFPDDLGDEPDPGPGGAGGGDDDDGSGDGDQDGADDAGESAGADADDQADTGADTERPLTYEEVLWLVEQLGPTSSHSAVRNILRDMARADLDDLQRGELLRLIKKLTGRSMAELRDTLEGLERPDHGEPGGADVGGFLGRYLWVTDIKRFYDLRTGDLLDDAQHSVNHPEIGDPTDYPRSAAAVFKRLAKKRNRVVHCLTYRPGGERLLGEVRRGLKRACVNTWRPSAMVLPQRTVTDAEVALWLELMGYVIPDEPVRDHLLNWMAFTAQHPDQKINHSPLLISQPGVGKDTLFVPLFRGIGMHNVINIGNDDLTNGWTDWAATRKIATVQEINAFVKGNALSNSLKPFQAAPPEFLRINSKNVPQYEVPNLINMVFFSNFEKALKIDNGDRRFFVYACRQEPKADEWYVELWRWLNQGGDALVMKWLMQRDVTAFQPARPAPMTADKAAIIEAGRSEIDRYIESFVRDRRGVADTALAYVEELRRSLEANAPKALANRFTDDMIAGVLKGMGCAKLGQARLGDAGRRVIWALYHVELVKRIIGTGDRSQLRLLWHRLRREDEVSKKRERARALIEEGRAAKAGQDAAGAFSS